MVGSGGRCRNRGARKWSGAAVGLMVGVLLVIAASANSYAHAGSTQVHENSRSAGHSSSHDRQQAHRNKQGKRRKHDRSRRYAAKGSGPGATPGVTFSPDGWVHYEPTIADTPAVVEQTVRVQGSPTKKGGCGFDDNSAMPAEGQEILREEIAYNPETCEADLLEKIIAKPPSPGDAGESDSNLATMSTGGPEGSDPEYKTGHNMQMWVDPVGITITGLSLDLSWPLYGAKGRWGAVPYSFKFPLDGWESTKLKMYPLQKVSHEGEVPTERMWGQARAEVPAGGRRAIASQRFENIDFYQAVKSAKLGFVCDNVPIKWTVFSHEVQVVGYYSGRMGTSQRNTKSGPCSELVHKREKVAWGLKRANFPKEFGDEIGNALLPWHAFSASPDEVVIDESNAPVPYGLLPTEVNPTSVRLEGGINPRGVSTNWWAQCGTTTAYGMWLSTMSNVGAGTASVPIAVTVPNLQPNTTYHCRLITLNVQGEAAYSEDEEFTTLPVTPPGPAVWTNEAFEIRQKSAILTGFVHPQGKATKYYFEYGYWTNYGSTVPAPPGGDVGSGVNGVYATNEITGLEPGHDYHYRIVASNGDGTTYGADRTFETLGSLPPDATTEPASEIRPTSARLNATINPNGADTRYYIEYGKASNGSSNYEATLPVTPPFGTCPCPPSGGSAGSGVTPVSVSEQATGLKPGTAYNYRVVAVSSGGATSGAEMTFTTVGPGIEILPPAEVTQSKITMAAKVDGVGLPTTYWFEYGNGAGYGFKTEAKALPAGTGYQPVSAAVEGLPVGWTVHYRIVATSSEGTNASSDQVVTTGWKDEPSYGSELDSVAESLNDVSCASAGSCVAVGGYLNRDPWQRKIAASLWDGANWTPIDPPSPAGYFAELESVSCATATSCLAVGAVVPAAPLILIQTVVMKWDGSTWTEIPGPQSPPGVNYHLMDISCPAVDSCEGVGYRANVYSPNTSEEIRPLAMHWDGSSWTMRASVNPNTPGGEPGKEGSLLASVSCASASFCKAVGRHYSSVGGKAALRPLIENLSGTGWVAEAANTSSYPATETHFWLEGVACPTTTACFAVGYSGAGQEDSDPKKAFGQRWTGSQWVGLGLPEEANGATELYDVSCSSATSCSAVGKNGRGAHWTGGEWKLQVPKPPSDSKLYRPELTLKGVSCPTTIECHAVGSYVNDVPRVERLTQGWSGAGVAPRTSLIYPEAVSETTAILRGSVDPAGVDSKYYFEYGPTTSYGSKTAEFSAGSGAQGLGGSGSWFLGKAAVGGLSPGTKYHYRIVANNGSFTVNGPDYTFETYNRLAQMPITEAFNGATTPVSDFATKWSPLFWTNSTHKGKNNVDGFGPTDETPNGAYFLPKVADPGVGLAAQATLAVGPGSTGRASLWLDMPSPGTVKSGYELRFQATSAGVYTVTLKKWTAGTEQTLGTKTSYPFAAGSSMALVDEGETVSVLTDTGSGLTKLISGTDASFSGGNAGVEVSGSTATRMTKFKVGALIEKAANFEAATKAIPVADAFARNESPLSLGGAWSAMTWPAAPATTGKVEASNGWSSGDTTVKGAYWQKAPVADTGSGDAVLVTTNVAVYGGVGGFWSLWLNAPNPGTAKSGYQLRLSESGAGVEAKLIKWVGGVATTLATKSMSLGVVPMGSRFALIDKGATVSAWSSSGGTGVFSQMLSATDSTYSYGVAGIEGSGFFRLRDLKLGPLPPY